MVRGNRVNPQRQFSTSGDETSDSEDVEEEKKHRTVTFASTNLSTFIILLPIVDCLLSLSCLAISYIVALERETIKPPPFVPFVTDMTDTVIARSILVLGVSISSHITLINYLMRYWYVRRESEKRKVNWPNTFALLVSIISLLGGHIASSFPTNTLKVNGLSVLTTIGAVLYVVGACMYCILQLSISCKLKSRAGAIAMFMRCSTTIVGVAAAICFAVFAQPSIVDNNATMDRVGRVMIWLFIACKSAFMLSFVDEFRKVSPEIIFESYMKAQVRTQSKEEIIDKTMPRRESKDNQDQLPAITIKREKSSREKLANIDVVRNQIGLRRGSAPVTDAASITKNETRRGSLQPVNKRLSTFTSDSDLARTPPPPTPVDKQWSDFKMLQIRAKQIRSKETLLMDNQGSQSTIEEEAESCENEAFEQQEHTSS